GTAGFPRYGFKASLSGRAFPNASAVKPAPGLPVCAPGLHRPFARFHDGRADPALCPDPAVLPRAAVRAALVPLYPRGPWLRSEFCCLGPSSLTPTPSASLAGTRRLHGPRLYAAPSLCGSAEATRETFPTFPAVLSMRAVDPTPVGSRWPSRCASTAMMTGAARRLPVYAATAELPGLRTILRILATGTETIIGRDLLNRMVARLDGPAATVSVKRPRRRRR